MSDESKAWEFKDGTKVTTLSSGESMDYFYASAPENRPRSRWFCGTCST